MESHLRIKEPFQRDKRYKRVKSRYGGMGRGNLKASLNQCGASYQEVDTGISRNEAVNEILLDWKKRCRNTNLKNFRTEQYDEELLHVVAY